MAQDTFTQLTLCSEMTEGIRSELSLPQCCVKQCIKFSSNEKEHHISGQPVGKMRPACFAACFCFCV